MRQQSAKTNFCDAFLNLKLFLISALFLNFISFILQVIYFKLFHTANLSAACFRVKNNMSNPMGQYWNSISNRIVWVLNQDWWLCTFRYGISCSDLLMQPAPSRQGCTGIIIYSGSTNIDLAVPDRHFHTVCFIFIWICLELKILWVWYKPNLYKGIICRRIWESCLLQQFNFFYYYFHHRQYHTIVFLLVIIMILIILFSSV